MTAQDAGRLMQADAPVRNVFFRSDAPGWSPLGQQVRTPMSRMLFGGQGGEVRLKLYLSLLWLGARRPYAVEGKPSAAWARLFGLLEPDKNGAQRVAAAIDWLVDNGFVTAVRQRGRPAKLTPRHETGAMEYTRPQERDPVPEEDWFRKLPQELWSKGWMGVLSGAALASFIIALDETERHTDTEREERTGQSGRAFERITWGPFVWLAERVIEGRYRLSFDLWEKGRRELAAHGLIKQRLRGDVIGFGPRHKRRQVQIDFDVLAEGPTKPT